MNDDVEIVRVENLKIKEIQLHSIHSTSYKLISCRIEGRVEAQFRYLERVTTHGRLM